MDIKVKIPRDNCKKDQEDMAKIFVEGFYDKFSGLCNDKEILINILMGSFCSDSLYIAYINDKAVGIIATSDKSKKVLSLDKKRFRTHLGFLKGTIAYRIFEKEFNRPFNYLGNAGYIEFITTLPEARGKNVAKTLLKFLIEDKKYSQLILEVGDTNKIALNFYEKMGFGEFERKKEKYPKQTGFNERILMKLSC